MYKNLINLLEDLIVDEYLQRDVYETYNYHLFGLSSSTIQEHLAKHMAEEEGHIKTLQRFLMEVEAEPITFRKTIPEISPPSQNILRTNLELEKTAVEKYSKAIRLLETPGWAAEYGTKHSALRVELENILIQEKEHVQDLVQWLRE